MRLSKISIVSILSLMIAGHASGVCISTGDGNGADGYASSLFPTPFENEEHTKAKFDRGGGGLHNKTYIRFDLTSQVDPITSVELLLTLDVAPEADAAPGETVGVDTFDVYGLNDANAEEAWVETQYGILWEDAPANDLTPQGLIAGSVTHLGTFQTTSGVNNIGDTISFSSPALQTFLDSDTDNLATLIFIRQDKSFAPGSFATKEHSSLPPPRLVFNGATCPVIGCPATPAAGCDTPTKSILLLKDKNEDGPGDKDKVLWKYIKGPAAAQADFGDPTDSTGYTFCVYDGLGEVVVEASVDPGGTCFGKDCWKALSTKGYKFKDKGAAQNGIFNLLLKGNETAAKSKVLVKGKDANLNYAASSPLIDTSAPVAVRLINDANSNCWGADFPASTVIKNTGALFKAKN